MLRISLENRARIIKFLPWLILIGATLATYSFSVDYPILESWDDPDHISKNAHLAMSWDNILYWCKHPILGIYMPLTMFSYMFDHLVWGLNPEGFRLQNYFWHISAVLAVYCCFRRLGIKTTIALIFALIFSLHPQRVESTIWLSERKDVLCAGIYFWAVYFYIGGLERDCFNWRAFILFVLALFAKPMAVSLPFIFVCLEFYSKRHWKVGYYLKRFLPYFFSAVVFMVITTQLQVIGKDKSLHFTRQLPVVINNIYWYWENTFFPRELSPIYPRVNFTMTVLVKLILAYLGAGLLSWFAWRRHSRVFIYEVLPLAAAYLFALAPVVGIFQIGFIDRADRYSYIPSAFILLGAAALIQVAIRVYPTFVSRWKYLLVAMVGGYLFYLICYNVIYAYSWKDFNSLIRVTCMRPHPNDIALIELGLIEYKEKNFEEVFNVAQKFRRNKLPWMDKGDIEGQEIYATYFEATALFHVGDFDGAEKRFSAIAPRINHQNLAKKGIFEDVMLKLFMLSMKRKQLPLAMKYLNRYLNSYDKREKTFHYYFYRGMRAMLQKRYSEAVENFATAAKLNPGDDQTRQNLLAARKEMRTVLKKKNKKKVTKKADER